MLPKESSLIHVGKNKNSERAGNPYRSDARNPVQKQSPFIALLSCLSGTQRDVRRTHVHVRCAHGLRFRSLVNTTCVLSFSIAYSHTPYSASGSLGLSSSVESGITMEQNDGHYTPPPIVFDSDEASSIAQPLLREHERGSLLPF